MYFKILWTFVICTVFGHTQVQGLRDGDLYRFTSVVDDHVITVGPTDPTGGTNITIEPWQEGSDQKWLAVQAIQASDSYLLLPKRQTWNWNKFVKDTTKDRLDFLPDNTTVMAEDAISGSVTQQVFNGKRPQQWKSVDVGQGKSLIKSRNDEKCLYNPGQPKDNVSFLTKIKHGLTGKRTEKVRPKILLTTKDCNPVDQTQLWTISVVV